MEIIYSLEMGAFDVDGVLEELKRSSNGVIARDAS